MIRNARIQHVPQYIQGLRQAIGLYLGWIPPTSLVAEAYDALQQDPTVQYAMDHLSLLVAGKSWHIETMDKRYSQAAQCIEDGMKYVSDFTHARRALSYGALYGMSCLSKTWERRYVKLGGVSGLWWVPIELEEIDPRRFIIERDVDDRNKCYWTIWQPTTDTYVMLESRKDCPDCEYAIEDYIWYFDEHDESMGGYGLGLGHKLYATCLLKSSILQYRAELAETWARPWLIGKLDLAAGTLMDTVMGPSGFAGKSDRATAILDVLDKMRARHVMVTSKDDELEVKEAGGTADNILGQFIDYLDRSIIRLILHTEDSSGNQQGSFARQKVYQGEQDCHVAYRKDRIEEVITRDLVQDFVDRNRIHFLRVGVPPDNTIFFRVKDEIRDEQDKEERKNNTQLAVQIGLKLKETEVYDSLGFTQPTADDAVFQPPQQASTFASNPGNSLDNAAPGGPISQGVPGGQGAAQNPFLSKLLQRKEQVEQSRMAAQSAVYERLLRI